MALTATALTDLAHVYNLLQLSAGDGVDGLLEQLVEAASDAAIKFIGYDPHLANYVEWFDSEGDDTILLRYRPITAIHALSDAGASVGTGSSEYGSANDYVWYPEAGIVRLASGAFGSDRRGIYCYYEAGYSPIPDDIQDAICEVVQDKYADRGTAVATDDVKSEKVGDYAVEYVTEGSTATLDVSEKDFTDKALATLRRYRATLHGAV
jgi:hypothetical protein